MTDNLSQITICSLVCVEGKYRALRKLTWDVAIKSFESWLKYDILNEVNLGVYPEIILRLIKEK